MNWGRNYWMKHPKFDFILITFRYEFGNLHRPNINNQAFADTSNIKLLVTMKPT